MANPLQLLEAPIPKPLLYVGTPIAGLFLIILFVFLGFPYGRLAPLASHHLSEATRQDVYIDDIEPRLTLGGPGLAARHIEVRDATGRRFDADPIAVRPAWSLSWLRLAPAFAIQARSALGDLDGIVEVSSEPRLVLGLRNVDLARLPLPNADVRVSGLLDADADLVVRETLPAGTVRFSSRTGIVGHSALPVDIEYETLEGDLLLGREHLAEIRKLELNGPIANADVKGTVSQGRRKGDEPLDLDVQLEIKAPMVQGMLREFGVDLDQNGGARFRIGGTLDRPVLK